VTANYLANANRGCKRCGDANLLLFLLISFALHTPRSYSTLSRLGQEAWSRVRQRVRHWLASKPRALLQCWAWITLVSCQTELSRVLIPAGRLTMIIASLFLYPQRLAHDLASHASATLLRWLAFRKASRIQRQTCRH
jgi:hypothetical protein